MSLELDGLHIAVFIASLLEGNGVRELVDGLTSTMVLVLGRFDSANKPVLDDVRRKLRDMGYTAVVFDSAAPSSRDTPETVSVLGRLSRFVIADLTAPKSSPHELAQFVADCSTPVQVVVRGEEAFSMFPDLEKKYAWVLPAAHFLDGADLVADLPRMVERLERTNEENGVRQGLPRRANVP